MAEKEHYDSHFANPTLGRLSSSYLPRMNDQELAGLCRWIVKKQDQGRYEVFTQWLATVVEAEILRRKSDGQIEQQMIQLPAWPAAQLADCLLGAVSLSRIGLTEAQGTFVREALLVIVVDAYLTLKQLAKYEQTQNT